MVTSSNRNIFRVTALCEGNPPVDSLQKGQGRGAYMLVSYLRLIPLIFVSMLCMIKK